MIACSRHGIAIFAAKWLRRVQLGVSMLALILCLGTGTALAGQHAPVHDKWHGWWELGGTYGTDDASRGEVTIFLPLGQTATSLFFADLRGKFFEENTQEGNMALGHRRMLNSGWNLGLWGGLDVRSTDNNNTFWQASGGLEALSDRWDLRANGYVPLSDPESSPSLARVLLSGNSIFMTGGEEVPLYGIDGEIGFKVFGGHRNGVTHRRRSELRVYGGGFWFDAEEALEEVAGPKARIEFRIEDIITSMPGSRLTLEGEFSHDDVREDKWEIGARLRIPFGSSRENRESSYASLSPQARRMTEGLERDTDIVTAASEAESVIDNATNVAMNQVAIANSAANLITGVGAGANTLIIVQGTGANIDVSATDGQALQESQTIQGGGSTIQMRGSKSSTVANFTAPGTRPTLFSSDVNGSTGVVTVASSSHVAGLNIQGNGGTGTFFASNFGIRGLDGLNNVAIEKNTISNTGAAGMLFQDNNSNVSVSNNTFTNLAQTAVFFRNSNSSITVSGNAISNVSGVAIGLGVQFNSFNNNVTISGNSITNVNQTNGDGISIGSANNNFRISENTIVSIGNIGLRIGGNNTNALLSNNTFTTIGDGDADDDVFEFPGAGNTLLPGSTGNVITTAPNAGLICRGAGNFTGTLEVTDQLGVLQTFTNGC